MEEKYNTDCHSSSSHVPITNPTSKCISFAHLALCRPMPHTLDKAGAGREVAPSPLGAEQRASWYRKARQIPQSGQAGGQDRLEPNACVFMFFPASTSGHLPQCLHSAGEEMFSSKFLGSLTGLLIN